MHLLRREGFCDISINPNSTASLTASGVAFPVSMTNCVDIPKARTRLNNSMPDISGIFQSQTSISNGFATGSFSNCSAILGLDVD
ncbi:MAG: hypothetical protein HOA30_07670 [Rhodospirillaceae bacterium]|nr:hypothetical protein [Rhodospirillaceae bacterium]